MSSGDEQLTQDVMFDVLSSTRRRQVLHLLKQEGPMELTELAEHVAAMENDTTVEELTKQQRKRVYVSLYQTHVPRLEEAGLVSYDTDTNVVELQALASDVDRYLEGDDGGRWQYVYLALAVIGTVLVALTYANVWVFADVGTSEIAVTLIAAVALTGAAHFFVWVSDRFDRFSWP